MNRMWEIREGHRKDEDSRLDDRKSMASYKDESFDEGYDCGYEDGYRHAMKEARKYYGERGGSMGMGR